MSGATLELQGLTRRYADGQRSLDVLKDASLTVAPGELVAIEGRSGSGKSTLLHVAGGLDRAYTGAVRVDGVELATLDDQALSRFRARTTGFVFQSFNLLPALTVFDNVTLSGYFADAGADAQARARQALDDVGLADKGHRRPGELSGGERQRVAIARALWSQPRLLLADEPTGNLDEHTGGRIIELLTKLNAQRGVTLVIVTHEKRVSQVAHRVVRLNEGRLEEVPR